MASSNGGNITTFIYNDEQILIVEIISNQSKNSMELARWFIAYLKVSKYNDVREIVELYIINNCTRLYRYNIDMIRPLYIYPSSRSSGFKVYGSKQS